MILRGVFAFTACYPTAPFSLPAPCLSGIDFLRASHTRCHFICRLRASIASHDGFSLNTDNTGAHTISLKTLIQCVDLPQQAATVRFNVRAEKRTHAPHTHTLKQIL